MRAALLLTGAACALFADTAIEGPRLGYISTNAGVRSVLGIVGASRLSQPVAQSLNQALVLPGSNVAVGIRPTGELVRVDLQTESVTELGAKTITKILASPGGESFAALRADGAVLFSRNGEQTGELSLPGVATLLAVADKGVTMAGVFEESDGQALYVLNGDGARRLLHAKRFVALAFVPNSQDFVIADDAGVTHRIGKDLQLTQVATVPGVLAVAVTEDGSRLLAIADHTVYSVNFTNGDTAAVDCSCTAEVAKPLGSSKFLLTERADGPLWLVDASGTELRIAFIPEAVNE